jgi:hypothetical protein
MGLRWWWNLTVVGKLLVLLALAALSGAGWALYQGVQAPGQRTGTAAPLPPSPAPTPTAVPTPTVVPTPTPLPTPLATATPPRSPTPPPTATPRVVEAVRVLYTTCEGDGACGFMASGERVHPGAAACNPVLAPFGTRLRILGWDQELVCKDIHPTLQGWYVVVWFATEAEGRAFRQRVGPTATIEVVYVPPR